MTAPWNLPYDVNCRNTNNSYSNAVSDPGHMTNQQDADMHSGHLMHMPHQGGNVHQGQMPPRGNAPPQGGNMQMRGGNVPSPSDGMPLHMHQMTPQGGGMPGQIGNMPQGGMPMQGMAPTGMNQGCNSIPPHGNMAPNRGLMPKQAGPAGQQGPHIHQGGPSQGPKLGGGQNLNVPQGHVQPQGGMMPPQNMGMPQHRPIGGQQRGPIGVQGDNVGPQGVQLAQGTQSGQMGGRMAHQNMMMHKMDNRMQNQVAMPDMSKTANQGGFSARGSNRTADSGMNDRGCPSNKDKRLGGDNRQYNEYNEHDVGMADMRDGVDYRNDNVYHSNYFGSGGVMNKDYNAPRPHSGLHRDSQTRDGDNGGYEPDKWYEPDNRRFGNADDAYVQPNDKQNRYATMGDQSYRYDEGSFRKSTIDKYGGSRPPLEPKVYRDYDTSNDRNYRHGGSPSMNPRSNLKRPSEGGDYRKGNMVDRDLIRPLNGTPGRIVDPEGCRMRSRIEIITSPGEISRGTREGGHTYRDPRHPHRLFIGGLPSCVTEGELWQLIESEYGPGSIVHVRVALDHKHQSDPNKYQKGYAFLVMGSHENCEEMLRHSKRLIGDKVIEIKRMEPETPYHTEGNPQIDDVINNNVEVPPENKLFLGDVYKPIDERDLYHVFNKFDVIKRIIIVKEKNTNKYRGYAFIYFASPNGPVRAMESGRFLRMDQCPSVLRSTSARNKTIPMELKPFTGYQREEKRTERRKREHSKDRWMSGGDRKRPRGMPSDDGGYAPPKSAPIMKERMDPRMDNLYNDKHTGGRIELVNPHMMRCLPDMENQNMGQGDGLMQRVMSNPGIDNGSHNLDTSDQYMRMRQGSSHQDIKKQNENGDQSTFVPPFPINQGKDYRDGGNVEDRHSANPPEGECTRKQEFDDPRILSNKRKIDSRDNKMEYRGNGNHVKNDDCEEDNFNTINMINGHE